MHSSHFQPGALSRALVLTALLALSSLATAAPARPTRVKGVTYNPVASLSREHWQWRASPGGPVEDVARSSRFSEQGQDTLSDEELLRRLGVALPSEFEATGLSTPLSLRQATSDTVTVKGSKSTLTVKYLSSTPAEARVAYERALKVWSEEFPCKLPIRINFSWQTLGGSTLGATSSGSVVSGKSSGGDKLNDDTVYSPVMAMALQGTDFTPNEYVSGIPTACLLVYPLDLILTQPSLCFVEPSCACRVYSGPMSPWASTRRCFQSRDNNSVVPCETPSICS
jgi:hypothetical protein